MVDHFGAALGRPALRHDLYIQGWTWALDASGTPLVDLAAS